MNEPILVPIIILGIEYNISCITEEKDALLQSAVLLNERLIELKEEGGLTTDQASMMVALNFANDLIKAEQRIENMEMMVSSKLNSLSRKIDTL